MHNDGSQLRVATYTEQNFYSVTDALTGAVRG
jgi:hypothetical protein